MMIVYITMGAILNEWEAILALDEYDVSGSSQMPGIHTLFQDFAGFPVEEILEKAISIEETMHAYAKKPKTIALFKPE